MTWHQAVIGTCFAVLLVALGIHFLASRQANADRCVFIRAYGIFFVILGGMLGFAQLFLEGPAQRLADLSDAAALRGEPAPFNEEDRRLAALWGGFWILFLKILLGLAFTAFVDALKNRTRRIPRRSLSKTIDLEKSLKHPPTTQRDGFNDKEGLS